MLIFEVLHGQLDLFLDLLDELFLLVLDDALFHSAAPSSAAGRLGLTGEITSYSCSNR
jgi:hypothetical protein